MYESLLRPVTCNARATDNFDTTYDGIVSYEMKRAMVCVIVLFSAFVFF